MRTLMLFIVASTFLISAAIASEIIFKDTNGKVLTKKDLHGYAGTATWQIKSERTVSRKAMEYHEKGRQYGQQGDYKKSIEFLKRASGIDPEWAYPIYDMAYTYILNGDPGKALELYKKVNSMSPKGFFTTKTAIHTLEREASGIFPKGLYLAYINLEWMEPQKKSEAVRNLVKHIPSFAPGWKVAASLTEDDEVALSAIENGLKSDPDTETFGILMVNKALLLHRNGKKKEAINILGELAMNNKSSLATEKIAKQTLLHILESK